MKTIVFDTETTGLPAKSPTPEDSVLQPWPVQISAVALDDQLQIVGEFNELAIPPDGCDWQVRAMEITGITWDTVRANGRPVKEVLWDFVNFCKDTDVYAAYNFPFDYRVIRQTGLRLGYPLAIPAPSDTLEHLCLMEWATLTLGARYQLGQAYKRITGKRIENAHDAMADTLAAVEIMRALYVAPSISAFH
jgi:DNA polymerase-3 subunit alpha